MGPYLYGYPWLLWAWPRPDDVHARHIHHAREVRPRRLFGKRRTAKQAPDRVGTPEPSEEVPSWRYIQLLQPVTEDDLIAFGRELEATDEVVSRLLAES